MVYTKIGLICFCVWNGNKIYCILYPGAESKFDAYFEGIFEIWGKKPGGVV